MYNIKKNLLSIALKKLSLFHWQFFMLICLLISVGLLTIHSVDSEASNFFFKHLLRIGLGLFLFFCVSFIHIKVWYKLSYPFYFFVILLLLYVNFFGTMAMGAQRWINLYFFNIQPSELMKIGVIIALAKYYQYIKLEEIDNISKLFVPILIILIPFFLVSDQPDLGTAIFILVVSVGMLWLAGLNFKIFITGFFSLIVLVPFIIAFLKPYQKQRILTFLDPEKDPLGAGYHIIQSKIAIGSGGLFGKGYLKGSQTNLEFLPEKHTDFIFTVFAEQFGFIGCILLIFLFIGIILIILNISLNSKNNFSRLLCFGIALNIFLYLAVNLGMVTGLLPVVGVPLPIVSYGGTAMLTTMFGMGLVMSAKIHNDYQI